MPGRSFHPPTAVATALAMAAVATGSQIPMIRAALSDQYEALNAYPSTDLVDLVSHHFDSTQARFLVYAHLHRHAAGTALVTFRGAGLEVEQLYGLSDLRDVEVADYDPAIDDGTAARLDAAVVARGEDEAAGPYAVAVGPETTTIVAVRHAGRLYLADQALLAEASPVASRG